MSGLQDSLTFCGVDRAGSSQTGAAGDSQAGCFIAFVWLWGRNNALYYNILGLIFTVIARRRPREILALTAAHVRHIVC